MKTILLTGGTSGIGLESAVDLAKSGARVVLVGRDAKKTADKVEEVKRRSGASNVESLLCDFGSQKSIRALADAYRAKYDRLDVLVNNAGSVFDKRTTTEDGIEATFAVNHLGPFLLTNLLLDLLVKSAPARIVNVSSRAHYRSTIDFENLGYENGGYGIMAAYGRSKLGNVLFTRELSKRLEGKGVTVNALHPGAVATNIWAGAPSWAKPALALLKLFMRTPEQGGQTITHLAIGADVEGKTGLYFDEHEQKTASREARDDSVAQRLWAKSLELTHLPSS
ncbi:MAG: SDR family oxidoreductase [Myxococcaceae bacterium]|nr:SDR family oxidoreductase [Myxococcaceae bacterium]